MDAGSILKTLLLRLFWLAEWAVAWSRRSDAMPQYYLAGRHHTTAIDSSCERHLTELTIENTISKADVY
jgi:hypothetical protein